MKWTSARGLSAMKLLIVGVLLACAGARKLKQNSHDEGKPIWGRRRYAMPALSLETSAGAPAASPAAAMSPSAADPVVVPVTAMPTAAPLPANVTWKDSLASLTGSLFGPTAGSMTQHEWWVIVRNIIGWCVLTYGVWVWTWFFPRLYMRQWEKYQKEAIEGRTFNQYLNYHFNYWLSSGGLSAMFEILFYGILTLLTCGALLFMIFMQQSPVKGLWLCTLWASAASIDPAVTAMEGGIGIITTAGGLVLIAVLLTAIADFFAAQQRVSSEGRDPIVEGGHLVLLGFSAQTKQFLEELAICESNGAPTTVAILDTMNKSDIEDEIKRQNTNTGNLKIVCRCGLKSSAADLWKVGADVASRVVILDDPSKPRDEADALTFGTLLTLKGQGKSGWPNNGHISVQCCLGKNVEYMSQLYPVKTFCLSSERLGRLMVQSAQDQGLCPIFNQIIGFTGDEFYAGNATELNLAGRTFKEIPFWCELAVPIGVRHSDGQYNINPAKDYVLQDDDDVIVLAEDDDALMRMEEPLFDIHNWSAESGFESNAETPDEPPKARALICNFTERGAGCAILQALDEMCAPGSECDLFCSSSEEDVRGILQNAEEETGKKLVNISLKTVYSTPSHQMTSKHKISKMPLASYDYHFVLADAALGFQEADEQTVAMIIQMKMILAEESPDTLFAPLVEICTPTADSQLRLCNITNTLNTTTLMSKALALVAIDTLAHGVLSDLLSAAGNNMDIKLLGEYMGKKKLPTEISFAEATAIVTQHSQQCVIGWSLDGEWIMNPKDKLAPRPWTPSDKVIVIKDV
eukprot:TRINITY_DN4726_c0_g1_i1.p1 TRINITY_DN4726_c0_g1~~TRINITY_DN4726_c0_g1_i1.p1  ORF type:complete len:804 (-),score=163.31 TRINITY_DN4726_c0_g1_i1:232-2643(-)